MQESVTVTDTINTAQPNEGTFYQILAGDDLQVILTTMETTTTFFMPVAHSPMFQVRVLCF